MFEKILNDITLFENNKNSIVEAWINSDTVEKTLKKHNLDKNFYRDKFALKIFDYALSVVKADNKLGECPVMNVMLMLFKKKNIPLSDVFIVCVELKNTLLHFTHNNLNLDNEMISEISTLMDFNFKGVIDEYVSLYYHDNFIDKTYKKIESKIENDNSKEDSNTYIVSKTTSALEYLQEVDIDNEIIAELDELEHDTLDTIDAQELITQGALQDSAELFTRYAKVLNTLYEFEELSYTLTILSDLISQADYLQMNDEMQSYIQIYLKAIISDLQSWRMSIFITHEAEDVHYLDKTLLSSISQLQITLMPHEESDEEKVEFF